MPYKDIEKRRQYAREYGAKLSGTATKREYQRRYRATHQHHIRNHFYETQYGITLEEYEQLQQKQNHCCALCGEKKRLIVDHCHDTGNIRGLLCHGCNTFEGMLKKYKQLGLLDKVLDWQNMYGVDNSTSQRTP